MARLALLLLALSGLAYPQADQPLPEGASLDIVVGAVKGEVEFQQERKGKWVVAAPGMALRPGTRICTGVESAMLISLGTNVLVRVDEATVIDIRQFRMDGDRLAGELLVDPGQLEVLVGQRPRFHTDIRVCTPRLTASVGHGRVDPNDTPEEIERRWAEREAERERERAEWERDRVRSYGWPSGLPLTVKRVLAGMDADRFIAELRGGGADSATALARFKSLRDRLGPDR